jgi:N utilization substance protein A
MPGERYYAHQKVRAFVLEVRKTTRGPQIILSRTHKNMLRRLLEYEVPEIYNGSVEIKSIARESGYRSKVAVSARQEGVDPVGACVGMRGVRIQSIVKELNDEKIDVIEWNPDQSTFIAKSLSPARVTAVYLDDDPISGRTAMVVVPDDQLSLAIGREGQNARLAAKLTNWRIDIKSLTEAATDAKNKIISDVQYADLLRVNNEMIRTVEAILQRKAEGRPLAPEDYALLAKLVEMVEKKMARGRQEERAAKVERAAAIKAAVPSAARRLPLAEAGLSDAAVRLLTEADYKNVGEILEVLALDEKRLLEVEGFSNKHLEEVKGVLGKLEFPAEPEPAAPAAEEAPAEPVAVETQPAVAEPVKTEAEPATDTAEVESESEEEEDYEAKDDEDEDDSAPGTKKKGKKKGKRRPAAEITYDEELGVYIKQKLRKSTRGGDLLGGEEE